MTIQFPARSATSSKSRAVSLMLMLFLTGILLGTLFVQRFALLASVFSGIQDGNDLHALMGREMSQVFLSCGKLLLVLYLLSFQRWGAMMVPVVFGIEGMYFGGTVGSMISFLGPSGAVLAILLLLFRLLLVIPYGFLLGAWAIDQSLGFSVPGDGRRKAGVLGLTLLVMLIAAFLESTLGRWLGGMYYLTFGV